MFPSPGSRAVMAPGHGTQLSSTAAMAAAFSSTPTMTFAFQPAPPTSDLSHHHGVLGYGSALVLDCPTTTGGASSSSSHAPSSTIPSSNLHHLHAAAAAHVSLPTRSSPPHPWPSDERNQDKRREKGAALAAGKRSGRGLQQGAARGVGSSEDEEGGWRRREGTAPGAGAAVLLQDDERRGRARRRLQVAQVRPEGRQEHAAPQELLPVHAGQLPGEEAGGAAGGGPPDGDHHLRGPARPLPLPRRRRRRRARQRRDELPLVAAASLLPTGLPARGHPTYHRSSTYMSSRCRRWKLSPSACRVLIRP